MDWSKIGFGAVFLLVSSVQLAVADCDPVKILIQDHYSLTTDNRNALVLNQQHDDITTKNQAIDTSYVGYGYATGKESNDFADAIHDKFNLDYRSSQQRWEAYTHLSDNARQAYADCLKASDENIFILPDPNTDADATTVLLNVKVRNYVPQKTPIVMQATFKYDQGSDKPGHLDQDDAHQTMQPGSTAVFNLTRDPSKPLTFRAKVGNQAVAFVIPPRPDFLIKREIRFSNTVTTYGHPCNDCHDTHQICVELAADDDAVVIPGTTQFVALKNVQDGLLHVMSPDGYSPRKVCMKGGQNVGRNNANLNFCGYLTAEVLVKVPRGLKESPHGEPPNYYKDYIAKKGNVC
jgi:hypothetical protein